MNRTERLYAIREELRRAGGAGRTADQLAERFEISARTVKRDISALQQGGFPVWARLGRVGGYVVDASATLPPVNITETEVSALASALAAHRGQPFYEQGQTALAKILGVMDTQARGRAERLAERIWINHESASITTTRIRAAIERALLERRALDLNYRDNEGQLTARRVDPQLLASTGGHWYLVAFCRLRADVRWFRLDHVEKATMSADIAADMAFADLGQPPPTARSLAPLDSPARSKR